MTQLNKFLLFLLFIFILISCDNKKNKINFEIQFSISPTYSNNYTNRVKFFINSKKEVYELVSNNHINNIFDSDTFYKYELNEIQLIYLSTMIDSIIKINSKKNKKNKNDNYEHDSPIICFKLLIYNNSKLINRITKEEDSAKNELINKIIDFILTDIKKNKIKKIIFECAFIYPP